MENSQPKKDWKVLERHYKNLSEVWEFSYRDQTRVSEALMILQGCIVEMHSDLIAFEQKNGNKATEKSKSRLVLLTEKLQILSEIQTENFNLKYHNKLYLKEITNLRQKLNIEKKIEKEQTELQNLPDSIKL